jgi:hypothetical protein
MLATHRNTQPVPEYTCQKLRFESQQHFQILVRASIKMTFDMDNFTALPHHYTSAPVHQVPLASPSSNTMFQQFDLYLWVFALGTCATFSYATPLRSYFTQYLEAIEWLFYGPQLLAKRYVRHCN